MENALRKQAAAIREWIEFTNDVVGEQLCSPLFTISERIEAIADDLSAHGDVSYIPGTEK